MEWIERFNEAINSIEEHLSEPIDYEHLGRIACCSSYHFQRMFTYMAGVSLSPYIRRRKMSLATVDLQSERMKIIDVAGKYGYNSPTAFNRAFQSVHKIAPSAVKNGGVSVKSFPPISFRIMVKGVEEMNYRIEEIPEPHSPSIVRQNLGGVRRPGRTIFVPDSRCIVLRCFRSLQKRFL